MEASDVIRAAQLFVEARRSGKPIRELPEACRPAHTRDVNAIVDAVTDILVREDGETIGGWKIGFVFSPRQVPMVCPLFNSRLFKSPARVPLALTPALRIEPEISFRLKQDLPARAKAYRAEELARMLTACASLEIIDSRFDTSLRSIRQIIDNPKTRLEAMADNNTTGGHAFSDPFLPCVVLANEMRHRGGMRAGDLLVTGSFSGFFEVAPDEPVTAEFAGFGSAEATFSTTSTK